MSQSTQREVFLVLTVGGAFLCLVFIAAGAFSVVDDWRSVASEIRTGNTATLLGRMKTQVLFSMLGGTTFIGTFLSYRRYHKLAFGSQ